jgi:hypothetical protein
MSVPESKDLDASRVGVDLVVQVIPSSTEQEPTNARLLGVASAGPDAGLRSDELERSLQVVDESERGSRAIGSPPRRRAADLCGGAERRPDVQTGDQRLLAEFSKKGFSVHELTVRRLLKRLFEGSLLFGAQLEGLVGFGDEYGNRRAFLERVALELELAVNHLAGCDAHVRRIPPDCRPA